MSLSFATQIFKQVRDLIHQEQGPLTSELLREPAGFGLGQVPGVLKPDAVTTSVCGYCATGCGLNIHLKNGEAINLSPSTNYPVNLGMACPKGWEALSVLDSPDRATTPLIKENGQFFPITWDRAMHEFVGRFKQIQQQHGPDSLAFLSTGQIPVEEMFYLGVLARIGMGIPHGDSNTRQCMATAAVSYKQSFGYDAPPYTYEDFELSDVMVFVGSNLCITHPIMWERVMRNPYNPHIIVIDPRMTETAMNATMHLPIKPKSDQYLLYGVAKVLIDNGWVDEDFISQHTSDYSAFRDFVKSYDLETVYTESGIKPELVTQLATIIHQGKRVSMWWTMGVNQSYQGVRTAQAIINICLMTGNIGKPGTGPNSVTGQCNAMGSRLFGNTTNLLGGHSFSNPQHREKIAGILGVEESRLPRSESITYPEIMENILRGKIKGLWVICTNPAHSWINQNQAKDILERLDFLVVQDMYTTADTAKLAHLMLPAAGWGEKDGVFINSERRLGVTRKVHKAPGQALSDFSIFQLVAHYWGLDSLMSKWSSPAEVFESIKKCSKEMPCDISGIKDYKMLDDNGGIQWPFPEQFEITDTNIEQHRRLFADGKFYHPDGRAKFLFEQPKPLSEPLTTKYPYILLTGRGTSSQWHTQTRTDKSAVLRKLYPQQAFVEINPLDAKKLGITQNQVITIISQRGQMNAQAFLTNAVSPGQLFIPMHYKETNQLTDAVFDPYSKQPSYKACAVQVRS